MFDKSEIGTKKRPVAGDARRELRAKENSIELKGQVRMYECGSKLSGEKRVGKCASANIGT